ncbi:hypothetical protein [Myxococcus sp. AB036A]|uniref:hypothetical protein n=1 Tax=Myxococcus sp. AB036A TaxID=2562793 RepID=UPI001891708F|nr:hypothetical protein [Myxococcus sp. AB036A]
MGKVHVDAARRIVHHHLADEGPQQIIDRDGRVIQVLGSDARLDSAIAQLRASEWGASLWGDLERSHVVYLVYPDKLGMKRGEPLQGLCGGPGYEQCFSGACAIHIRVDWDNQDWATRIAERRGEKPDSDLFLIADELAHGLDWVTGKVEYGGLAFADHVATLVESYR